MTTAAPSMYIVLTTSYGKYIWWPALQVVDYKQKGKQKTDKVVDLKLHENNIRVATRLAAKYESQVFH